MHRKKVHMFICPEVLSYISTYMTSKSTAQIKLFCCLLLASIFFILNFVMFNSGPGSLSNTYNGASNSFTGSTKRRKRNSFEPENNGDSSDDYNYGITEDHYRSMLTEHVQTYRRSRTVESVTNSDKGRTMPTRKPVPKKSRFSNDKEKGSRLHPDYLLATRLASSLDSPYLDLGEGITYRVPPTYDRLAAELKLPGYSDIHVEEFFLKGSLDLRSIAAMVASDKRAEAGNRRGLGQPQTQYESLQARAKAEKFSLQVNLDSFAIPEGAAGRIRRFILTENGTLQAYYVKVLEKGDTYEASLVCNICTNCLNIV